MRQALALIQSACFMQRRAAFGSSGYRPQVSSRCRVTALFVAALSFASPSEALEIICPEKILTAQKLDLQESGWQEFAASDGGGSVFAYSYVSGIAIYDSDPKNGYLLKEDKEGVKIWTFIKAPPEAPPVYMACHYSQTRVRIARALPKNIKKCTAKRAGVLHCDVFKP